MKLCCASFVLYMREYSMFSLIFWRFLGIFPGLSSFSWKTVKLTFLVMNFFMIFFCLSLIVMIFQDSSMNEEEANNNGETSGGGGGSLL